MRLLKLKYSANSVVKTKECFSSLNIKRFLGSGISSNSTLYKAAACQADFIPEKKKDLKNGPGLEHFIANSSINASARSLTKRELAKLSHPYVKIDDIQGHGRKVYFDVYGCQMNVSDAEVAWSILKSHGYLRTDVLKNADVVLVMTCSIREGAENKIWNKIDYLKGLKNKRLQRKDAIPMKIGILGCMAERLKTKLVEKEKSIDIVIGPDSYRDLPRLLTIVNSGETAVNVLLSHDETYADIVPVSLSSNKLSAFVSIMRGCDNMCSYCIVPFTRGKERSREMDSILDEVKSLSDQGVKEVTLLGQNVNSYRDTSSLNHFNTGTTENNALSKGFKTKYKPRVGGLRFSDLLDRVSQIDTEMRIRFTSPHPKDFPDEVLYLIKERNNIGKNLHLPAQSGNSRILELMNRGYTRESYLDLVYHIRNIIKDVALTTDMICGFCSETESEFEDTLSLMKEVKYSYAYMFPYSLREKTPAHRKLIDNVSQVTKLDRLVRMNKLFYTDNLKNNRSQIGSRQLVLIEGHSKRSALDLVGRNDNNTKVIIPNVEIEEGRGNQRGIQAGDYVEVIVTDVSSLVLKGVPLRITTLESFSTNVT
ncbi:unnamed protein product [Meganyctiphanes norvegica]|uniref:CDK5RAP1-like protein n=1 Tax=Meganyctiphanes norvegica TaxID=48144 RepID=A0AAV2SRT9_MEGNR